MSWNVEFTDEFEAWWNGLDEGEQVQLEYPHSSGISSSRHPRMRELRIQY